jgi:hypothetical protein
MIDRIALADLQWCNLTTNQAAITGLFRRIHESRRPQENGGEIQGDQMTTVWIYVDSRYHVGHPSHLQVFATEEAANRWFEEHDPEGMAFEYEVQE